MSLELDDPNDVVTCTLILVNFTNRSPALCVVGNLFLSFGRGGSESDDTVIAVSLSADLVHSSVPTALFIDRRVAYVGVGRSVLMRC